MNLISIILPVYNSEKFILNCVNSILIQTYRKFELIIIDDGSTDKSKEILKKIKDKDNRIHVITTDHKNPGEARNVGINFAKGDFITFIDSDDYIHPQYLEIMLKTINTHNSDIVLVQATLTKELFNEYGEFRNYDVKKLTQDKLFNLFFSDWKYRAVWGKLYKKNIINNKRFINQIYSEDCEFNTYIATKIKKAILIKSELYYHTINEGSLMHNITEKFFFDNINALYLSYENTKLFENNKLKYKSIILSNLYPFLYDSKNKYKDNNQIISLINNIYKKTKYTFFLSPYINIKNKIFFFIYLKDKKLFQKAICYLNIKK